MCNVLWVCVRLEDEGKDYKKGGDEKAKSRPGNETAGGIRTKFIRDWSRDVLRDKHGAKKKGG